ncbi:MAG: hypothetical protein Q8S53_07010 [Brevundimonas sp.]|uniref:hypothetical protein n=1 Tax=Brevundimonas sp. TaxID=1871086 RepID=UPI002734B33F|nr:hypothetical protein [Brevundimonas sp.]MDP3378098.1 hypothetical protein [Brevundimonas sp.]
MLRRLALALALSLTATAPAHAQTAVERAEADYLAATPLPVDARDESREWRLWWQETDPAERPAMEAERIAELERATARARQLAGHVTDFDSLATACPSLGPDACRVEAAGVTLLTGDAETGAPARSLYWQQLRTGGEWDMPRAAVILYTPRPDGRLAARTWVQTAIVHEPPVLVEGQGDLYVAVPGYHDGTGRMNADVLFRWTPGADRPFTQIDITSWKDDLAARLPPGLAVWKGVGYRWPALMAETSLWQESDANCCPTGGDAWLSLAIDGDRLVIEHLQVNDPLIIAAATIPPDILGWAGRRLGCDHWMGEEAYDAERGARIEAAVTELQCDGLEADEAALVAHYAGDAVSLARIERVRGGE